MVGTDHPAAALLRNRYNVGPLDYPGRILPRITPFSITTEAQDERARGEWLRLQAGAGLSP